MGALPLRTSFPMPINIDARMIKLCNIVNVFGELLINSWYRERYQSKSWCIYSTLWKP